MRDGSVGAKTQRAGDREAGLFKEWPTGIGLLQAPTGQSGPCHILSRCGGLVLGQDYYDMFLVLSGSR